MMCFKQHTIISWVVITCHQTVNEWKFIFEILKIFNYLPNKIKKWCKSISKTLIYKEYEYLGNFCFILIDDVNKDNEYQTISFSNFPCNQFYVCISLFISTLNVFFIFYLLYMFMLMPSINKRKAWFDAIRFP